LEPLNHHIVAVKAGEAIQGQVLVCNDMIFAYNARRGLWRQSTKPSLIVHMPIQE
jgi:ketopantoate hydroxymethyltransferase